MKQHDTTKQNNTLIILILGMLAMVTPFTIDMYLPAFPHIAKELHSSVARVSLSLPSYFIGLAIGQLVYGPLLDRFGRKKPLYVGMGIFIVASMGCLQSATVEELIAFRFLQAVGGGVAYIASMAMVRDFFPVSESAKILSLLMLIVGVSPLFAPTLGSVVTIGLGWKWVFIILAIMAVFIVMVVFFYLPQNYTPDPSVSLKPGPIVKNFAAILKEPQFFLYTISGALSFSGLMVYVVGSPIIFMEVFQVSTQMYGVIFAVLSVGFIGANQVNIVALKYYSSEQIFRSALIAQSLIGIIFLIGSLNGWYGLIATIVLLFGFLSCLGFTYPNAAALALKPFSKNIGSASALLGVIQISTAAFISIGVGLFDTGGSLPIIIILAVTATLGMIAQYVPTLLQASKDWRSVG